MAVPTKYNPSYSYSGFEAVNPASPKPGSELDNDFAQIEQSVGETIDALGQVRRSDGALANGIVGPDQLSDTLSIGFTLRGGWVTATAYTAGDGVTYGNSFYKANVSHTSAPATRPDLDSVTWSFLLTFSAIAITDGSVTPVKLDAAQAAGFRVVIGQEETVAEGVANVTVKTTPVDADKLPLVDSENSGVLRGLTFSALGTWFGTKLGPILAALSAKTTPVDADTLPIVDSEASGASKGLSWANLKAGIWTAFGALVAGGASKTTPVDGDTIPFSDSAASNASKKLTWANLKAALKSVFDTYYAASATTYTKTQTDALVAAAGASVTTYSTPGSFSFPKPTTGASVLIEVWGAGGSGGKGNSFSDRAACGGGGGSYAQRVVPIASLGATETVTVGAGGVSQTTGVNGQNGGNSSFGAWVLTYGGAGGNGNPTTTRIGGGGGGTDAAGSGVTGGGPTTFGGAWGGGDGGTSTTIAVAGAGSVYGGGGGGANSDTGGSAGGAGGASVYGGGGGGSRSASGSAGAGGTSKYGGAGGAGGSGSSNATAGAQPGGGGGGSHNGNSGKGGDGMVRITVF